MKFSCKTSDFLQAIQLVSRAISGQQALPILGNIHLQVEGRHCTMSATDLELSITTSIEANIENEGSITVPAKAILNFAQYNSDEEILLETSEGTQLKCTSPQAKTIIAGESASEYPTIATIEKEASFSLPASTLLEALQKVTFACAKTTLRPVLSGVFIRAEKKRFTLVATDSYRLSEFVVGEEVDAPDVSCIVPVKVLEEVRSALGASKSDKEEKSKEKDESEKVAEIPQVQVTLSSQQIEFQVGHTKLLSRLIDGKFPDYQQIIPSKTNSTITLSIKDLTTVVKRMHYFAKEINNNLTFFISKEGVKITTPQTQAGQDEATLSGELNGDDNKIALSSSYLLDFLSHTEGDTIEMKITDSMHPAVFHLPTNDLYLHLIMPLRIQEE